MKIKKLPSGPANLKFQEFSHDERLGKNVLTHTPSVFNREIGGSKTIGTALKDIFDRAYKKLLSTE